MSLETRVTRLENESGETDYERAIHAVLPLARNSRSVNGRSDEELLQLLRRHEKLLGGEIYPNGTLTLCGLERLINILKQ
jgi:hypothetical protein